MEIEDNNIQMFPKICRIGEVVVENSMKKITSDSIGNSNSNNGVVADGVGDNGNRLSRWHHHSSRIMRVSRASGGKDRHSKVWTSKGLRDRRVRLSVSTALQFYDLQDRLGYDQPSKAVEWLIKAAADAIAELPSLNASFPGDEEKIASSENQNQNQNQNPDQTASLSKSACSSNSDTSKNSGLSLSRSESRDKARERARERTAKEKERESNAVNDNSHTSFTELLTGSVTGPEPASVNPTRQWMAAPPPPAPMEYLGSGLILGSGQIHFPHQTPFSSISDHHQNHHHHHHHQEFSFVPEHLISPGGSGSYNLDFNISSSGGAATAAAALGGFSRGTLQSNSPNHQSFLNNLQRFSSDGAGAPFFVGTLPAENHHQHHQNHQFQLYYENGCRNSDQKGKGKS